MNVSTKTPPNPSRDIQTLRARMEELEAFKEGVLVQNTRTDKTGGAELSIPKSTSAAPRPSGRIGPRSLLTTLSMHSSRQGTPGAHSQVPSPRTPGSAGPPQQHQLGLGSNPWDGAPALEAQSEGGMPPSFPMVSSPARSPTSPMLASSPFRAPRSSTITGSSPIRMPSIPLLSPTLDTQAQGAQVGDASIFNPKDEGEDQGKGTKEPDSAVQFGETPNQPSPPAWGITPVVEENPAGGTAMEGEGRATSAG